MSGFFQELRIIPRIVWPIALLAAGTGSASLFFAVIPNDQLLSKSPLAARITVAAAPAFFIFATVLLIGYINADARRRGMRYVMWTLLAIFVPNGIGYILYFVLRDPILVSCPKCGIKARPGFVFCPQCGAEISPACPACKRQVETGWNRCASCGMELAARF
jgi:hypothetical protein